jgi:hypothetical protein
MCNSQQSNPQQASQNNIYRKLYTKYWAHINYTPVSHALVHRHIILSANVLGVSERWDGMGAMNNDCSLILPKTIGYC